MADLRHDGVSEEIQLAGLSEHEVAELIDASCDLEPRPGFVHSVRRETDGNPFFVQEICSHVGETGATAGAFTLEALGVPEGVKQVIGRRIARLPEGTERLLTIGALMGREFDLDLLVDVAGDDEDTVLDALEQACTARLVEEVAGAIGRYSFVHALTREALYDSLGATRRARLHRRVAEAIESRYAEDLEDHFGALAFHYAAAGTDVPKAVEYAGLAGDQALARLAHEDAARQFERGLDLLAEQDRARCDLLLGLAEARRRAGDVPGSQTAFAEAGNLARALGDAERLARAAVGSFRGHVMASPGWHDPVIALLEDALELLPVEDSGLRSRVLAALSLELYFTPEQLRGLAVSSEAIAMARRVGDDDALAFALANAHTALHDPGHLDARLTVSTELVAVSERVGNPELAYIGHVHRACDLLELTRVDDARRSARAAAEIVEDLGQPMQRYFVIWLQSTLALLEGRFDDAQRLSDEALDIGIAADHPDAFVVWGTQALVLGWQRGEVAHLVEPAQQLLEQFPDLTAWPAAVALTEVLAGLHDEARARLHAYTADLDVLDFGAIWVPALLRADRGVPHRRRPRVCSADLRATRPVRPDAVRREPEPVRDGTGEPVARRPRVAHGRLRTRRVALRRRTRDERAHRRSPARGADVSRLRPDAPVPRRRRRPRARAGAAHAGAIDRRADRAGWCLGRRRRPRGAARRGVSPQTVRTFCASSPFLPGAMSNSTRCPSSRVRYPSP